MALLSGGETVTPGVQSPMTKRVMGRTVVACRNALQVMCTSVKYDSNADVQNVNINHFTPLVERVCNVIPIAVDLLSIGDSVASDADIEVPDICFVIRVWLSFEQ